MDPMIIICWIIAATSLLTADNFMRGVAPIWAQKLLSVPVAPHLQEASSFFQHVIPVTQTVKEIVTIFPPPVNTPPHEILPLTTSLPTWDFSLFSEIIHIAYRILASFFGFLVYIHRLFFIASHHVVTFLSDLSPPSRPTQLVALALIVLPFIGLLAYWTCASYYASDDLLARLEREILQQNNHMVDLRHHYENKLRYEQSRASLIQSVSATYHERELSAMSYQIVVLQGLVETAENKANSAEYAAEARHQPTIDSQVKDLDRLEDELASLRLEVSIKEDELSSRDEELAALKAKLQDLGVTSMPVVLVGRSAESEAEALRRRLQEAAAIPVPEPAVPVAAAAVPRPRPRPQASVFMENKRRPTAKK